MPITSGLPEAEESSKRAATCDSYAYTSRRGACGALATKLLIGWDIGVVLYLLLVYQLMVTCGIDDIRRRAGEDDEGALALLVLTGISGLAIMGAIVAELGIAKISGQPRSGYGVAIAMITIFVSWAFVHTIFALHYAHEYYGARVDKAIGGLNFPGCHFFSPLISTGSPSVSRM